MLPSGVKSPEVSQVMHGTCSAAWLEQYAAMQHCVNASIRRCPSQHNISSRGMLGVQTTAVPHPRSRSCLRPARRMSHPYSLTSAHGGGSAAHRREVRTARVRGPHPLHI